MADSKLGILRLELTTDLLAPRPARSVHASENAVLFALDRLRGHNFVYTGNTSEKHSPLNRSYLLQMIKERMVGERGFEPPTPWSRTRCSTRLSHSPTDSSIFYYSLRRTAFAFDLLKIGPLGLTGIFLRDRR